MAVNFCSLLGPQKRSTFLPLTSYVFKYFADDRRLARGHLRRQNSRLDRLAYTVHTRFEISSLGRCLDISYFLKRTNYYVDLVSVSLFSNSLWELTRLTRFMQVSI